MRQRFVSIGLLFMAVAFSGCMTPHVVDTVPAWKGIPLMVLEPTSQEAQVWHDYFRERKEQRRAARGQSIPHVASFANGNSPCCSPIQPVSAEVVDDEVAVTPDSP